MAKKISKLSRIRRLLSLVLLFFAITNPWTLSYACHWIALARYYWFDAGTFWVQCEHDDEYGGTTFCIGPEVGRGYLTDSELAWIPWLHNLTTLAISESSATDQTLFRIAQIDTLRHLDIYCPNASRCGTYELRLLPNLECLEVCGWPGDYGTSRMKTDLLNDIHLFPKLRTLRLRSFTLDEQCAEAIEKSETLVEIELYYCTFANKESERRFRVLKTHQPESRVVIVVSDPPDNAASEGGAAPFSRAEKMPGTDSDDSADRPSS